MASNTYLDSSRRKIQNTVVIHAAATGRRCTALVGGGLARERGGLMARLPNEVRRDCAGHGERFDTHGTTAHRRDSPLELILERQTSGWNEFEVELLACLEN